ncbi:glycosyltransferase family 2 protein [Ligilactobacillus salivarius]|uniref:glycosyltransferase family 2 protein n=1 Tax=Ligilactobacillus salivarius TaxID=1624 RepID=UPI000C14ACB9|nr:glycosyltransferase family 2 protein [Ligilactobacillus salivarius]MDF4191008.1 glycosyltransferase family 2 protein [Ligilactobacillus salivarius]PHY97204.1 glycosyl transferase family 2 [Ligilactobacillus salivarius]
MVKVSIGMPVYNVAEYLPQCLDSIIHQTFTDFEVIMVDDGSTDGKSFEICQEYTVRDKRFKLIHQENGGRSAARNTALKNMTGEYITWIDSDDWVEPDYLKILVDTQIKTGADLVNVAHKGYRDGNIYVADYEGEYSRFPNYVIPLRAAIHDTFWTSLNLTAIWGSLGTRELYKGVVFSENMDMEDQGTKFKLYFKANKIVALPDMLYVYRNRQGSIMNPVSEILEERVKKTDDMIRGLENLLYYADITDFDIDFCFREFLGRMEYEIQIAKLSEEDKSKFREYIEGYKQKLRKYWGN